MSSPSNKNVTIHALFTAIPFLGIIWLLFALFAPGHFSGDTADSFFSATGEWRFDDWHSPMLGVIWRGLLGIWQQPQVLLLFNISCFCLATYLISSAQNSWLKGFKNIYWCGLFFLPFIFNYSGALIKDSSSAALVLLGVALYFTDVRRAHQLPVTARLLLHIVANLLVFIAILIKPAALFMAIPLFFFSLLRLKRTPSWGFAIKMGLLAAFVTPLLFSLSYGELRSVVNAKVSNIKNAIFIYDLTGMSHIHETNYLDGFVMPKNAPKVPNCYRELEWDNLAWGNCAFVVNNIAKQDLWKRDDLLNRWLYTAYNNPLAYVEHRLTHLTAVLTTKGKDLLYLDREDSRLPWKSNKNDLMVKISHYYSGNKLGHIFFLPIVWLLISLAILAWAALRLWHKPNTDENALVACLMLSNLAFFLTLLFFGVAYDFRYFYTVIWQSLIAIGLLFLRAKKAN